MAGKQPSRMRRVAFRISVVLFAFSYAALLSMALGILGPAWDAGGSGAIHRIHHLGGALFIAVLLIGLMAQLRDPERQVAAFHHATMSIVALEIVALIMGDPDNHGGNVGLIDPIMLIFVVPLVILAALHPARRELLRPHLQLRPGSAAFVLLGASPLVIYHSAPDRMEGLYSTDAISPAGDPTSTYR